MGPILIVARVASAPALVSKKRNVRNYCADRSVSDTAAPQLGLRKHMPIRQEAQFLRERAGRLREIAGAYRTALSKQLREMAAELDARADELEVGTSGPTVRQRSPAVIKGYRLLS